MATIAVMMETGGGGNDGGGGSGNENNSDLAVNNFERKIAPFK